LIHNEFHGEQPPHNPKYCDYDQKVTGGKCILWSTDLGVTLDGGASWNVTRAPLFTLPRRYIKNANIAGYGALGGILFHDGWYYGHVSRSYNKDTGAGPPGIADTGICTWRTRDPLDPTSYRGWNGTGWTTVWVNPYQHKDIPEEELWMYTCKSIDTGAPTKHANPRRFAGDWRPKDWPSHVMLGWPESHRNKLSYSFPSEVGTPGGAAPFTDWTAAEEVDISSWMDPHTIGGLGELMYPSLIDHDSPFDLAQDGAAPGDGLSYGLVGNRSLHVYVVFRRAFIVRFPVAWFRAGEIVPKGPFQPVPPNPIDCQMLRVSGAGLEGVGGDYLLQRPSFFRKDDDHHIYCSGKAGQKCRWRMAKHSVNPLYYEADEIYDGHSAVPACGWMIAAGLAGVPPFPTAICAPQGTFTIV